MNAFFNTIFRPAAEFLASPLKRHLFFIGVLGLAALLEFNYLGLARRTFVFYTVNDGGIAVEDRMIKHARSREGDIIRYAEETLLGPVAPDLLPLFPRGTKLKSLLYRNGVVYADFTADAALPPEEGGRTNENFRTFYSGILRNFSYVKDVRFFIEGNAAYAEGFRRQEAGNGGDFSEI
jgi:hypothetical protein